MVNTCSNCLSAHTHVSNHKLYNTINIFISIESLFHTYDLSNPNKIKRWPNNKTIRSVTYHQTKYLTKSKMQDPMLKNREKTEGWWLTLNSNMYDVTSYHNTIDNISSTSYMVPVINLWGRKERTDFALLELQMLVHGKSWHMLLDIVLLRDCPCCW
jgi:hypothetical protein